MGEIINETIDPLSRTAAEISQLTQVQGNSDDLIAEASSTPTPTAVTATTEAFLVTHWLVGQGEG
jgi:hypothetical protein